MVVQYREAIYRNPPSSQVSERLRDQFRSEGDSSTGVDCSSEIRHDGGHFIPPMSRYKEPLIAFLEQQLAQKGE